jgi:hypothetical protein
MAGEKESKEETSRKYQLTLKKRGERKLEKGRKVKIREC